MVLLLHNENRCTKIDVECLIMKKCIIIVAVIVGILVASGGIYAAKYTSAKALLIQAIDAPDGRAQGEIVGPIADKFRKTTKSNAPVMAEVTTIKSFKQEGCRRLNLRLHQANVLTQDGNTTEFVVNYGINLCRDGSPPIEGMDLEDVGNALKRQFTP